MKQLLYLIILSALALSSCSISTSDNGKLDGYWHLTGIDTLREGQGSTDLKQRRVYWAVQAKLLNVRDLGTYQQGYLFRFSHVGDSLLLSEPYHDGGHEDTGSGDTPVTDAAELSPFGINSLTEHFFVEQLSGSTMILRSQTLRLYFKRM